MINDSYSTYHEALIQIKKFIPKNSPTISKVDYFPNEDELNETFETDEIEIETYEDGFNTYITEFRVVEQHFTDNIIKYQLQYKLGGEHEWNKTNTHFDNKDEAVNYKKELTNKPLKTIHHYI